jgi:hypothetical protein
VVSPMEHLAGAVGISESEVSAPRYIPTRPFGMSGVDVSILTLGGKRSRTRFRSATLCAISCITVITEISNRLLGFSMNCRLIHVSALCRLIIRLFFFVNNQNPGSQYEKWVICFSPWIAPKFVGPEKVIISWMSPLTQTKPRHQDHAGKNNPF